MAYMTLFKTATAILAMASSATAAPRSVEARDGNQPSLTAQLQLADTTIDKFKLLKDQDFVFDFANGAPMATRQSFPALTGSGAAMAYAVIPPCSMVLLHQHPRADEIFIVTDGKLYTEMVPEAGVTNGNGTQRTIGNELSAGQMTIFPKGTFHTQINMECQNATAVASFTSDDPGTTVIVPATLALSDEVVTASFGQVFQGKDLNSVRAGLPKNAVIKVEQCLKKCDAAKN